MLAKVKLRRKGPHEKRIGWWWFATIVIIAAKRRQR